MGQEPQRRRRVQPVVDRRHHLDPDLHGGARHLDRQRRARSHRGRAVGVDRPGDLGADQLSGRQRDRHPAVGLAVGCDRAQALFPDLDRVVHDLLVPVRQRAEPDHAEPRARVPGERGRGAGAGRAVDARGHLPPREARDRLRGIRDRGGGRPGAGAGAGRIHRRELDLALDLPHQRAVWAPRLLPGRDLRRRAQDNSGGAQEEAQGRVEDRLSGGGGGGGGGRVPPRAPGPPGRTGSRAG